MGAGRARRWLVVTLFTGLGIVLLAGAYRGWHREGGKDWNAFCGQAQAEITSLGRYRQLPLWNPWRRGGQVAYAQPESMLLSPVTPLALALGVVPAFKLLLLPLYVVGCLGLYALAGDLGLAGLAQVVPPLVFFGSSIFPLYVSSGLPNWLFTVSTLPWLVLAYRRAIDDPRRALLMGAGFAALICWGDVYHFVFLPLFLGAYGACLAGCRRAVRPLLVLGGALAAGLAFAAVRLIPILQLYRQYPRELPANVTYLNLPVLGRALLDPRLPDLNWPWTAFVQTAHGVFVYWNEFGSYVGPVPILLALVGVFGRWRRTWVFTLPAAFFLWMTLGSGATPSLWDALHRLPVLGSMRSPQRLLMFVTFCLALLAGFGFATLDAAARRLAPASTNARTGALLLMLIALVAPMLWVNAPISRTAFVVEPTPGLTHASEFRQVRGPYRPEQWGGELYESVLANRGNITGISDVPVPPVVRAETDRDYRGEVYLRDGHGTLTADVSPNVIRVRATLTSDDLVVVNQNYFPGWRMEGNGVEPARSEGGLLAFPLPAGTHDVVLRFAPASVRHGLVASALAGLLALLAVRAPWRRHPKL